MIDLDILGLGIHYWDLVVDVMRNIGFSYTLMQRLDCLDVLDSVNMIAIDGQLRSLRIYGIVIRT